MTSMRCLMKFSPREREEKFFDSPPPPRAKFSGKAADSSERNKKATTSVQISRRRVSSFSRLPPRPRVVSSRISAKSSMDFSLSVCIIYRSVYLDYSEEDEE